MKIKASNSSTTKMKVSAPVILEHTCGISRIIQITPAFFQMSELRASTSNAVFQWRVEINLIPKSRVKAISFSNESKGSVTRATHTYISNGWVARRSKIGKPNLIAVWCWEGN